MNALFLNPGFLFIAAALISVPIIIHLINRMRFKRVRWAAMEFLLKAQKRTRRRLILEQLLLLALRCLLLALVGLLVSRFVGCGDTNVGGKPNLHLVLLDDTLSMQDQGKQGTDDAARTCFEVARSDVLVKKIAKGLSLSKTNDQLIIVPLSKIHDPEYQPKAYEHLNDPQRLKELHSDIAEMQPSMLHVNMLQGVKYASKIIANHAESFTTLHILGDFRQKDWGLPAGEGVTKELLDLVKNNHDVKVRLLDTVYPLRSTVQGSFPPARDNVGIVDVRPSTRIVGKNMPVQFTVSIYNFSGKQADVMLVARNELTGKDMRDVNYSPQNPIRLSPGGLTQVTFEYRFNPDIKPDESYFAHLSLRLTNQQLLPLDNDGLLADNLRHTVVEVREKVPILVIDGEASKGREEGKDSFFISRSLISVPGASYQVVYGDELAGGNPAKALERIDLNQYPTIFLLNVRELTPLQRSNLENYVKEGGGVAFYLGPLVNAEYYNKNLYKEGKGIFPAPLKVTYFPAPNDAPLEPKSGDTFQLLIRDEKVPDSRNMPIFGPMFEEPKHKEPLRDLPIRRYFQVNRSLWKQEPGRTLELATMPNDASVLTYQQTVVDIMQSDTIKKIKANLELNAYHAPLLQHLREIEKLVEPGSEAKAYHLANQIDLAFNDRGNAKEKGQAANMTEFWANSDPHVQSLRRELNNLREQVYYGDPLVVSSSYGKGKVVAVMSTAGKDWNDWPGGSASSVLYPMFVWEMQNYLSSQGSEANLTVGTNLDVALDARQFNGVQLKLVRTFMKTDHEKAAEKKSLGEQFGKEVDGQVLFSMSRHYEPGLYLSELVDANEPNKKPLAVYAHAFNVDTEREGHLQRVGSDELERELVGQSGGAIKFVPVGAPDDQLIGRLNDFSESPWLFLILLLVLVAEQALAVHLSFHLKNSESETAPAVRTGARAA